MGQRGDFKLVGVDDFGIPLHLFEQRLHHYRHLGFGSRFQVQLIEFSERIHGDYYTAIIRLCIDIKGL